MSAPNYDAIFDQAVEDTLGKGVKLPNRNPTPAATADSVPAAPGKSAQDSAYDKAFADSWQQVTGQKYVPPAERATAPAQAQATEAATAPERSFGQEMLHQAGLGVRMAAKGAIALPAMLTDAVTAPINAGMDLVEGPGKGYRFKPQVQALDDVLTAAGVAQPENGVERVAQDVGSAVSGAGGSIFAGKMLAKGTNAIVQGVGDALSAGPTLQAAAAATGAAASGTTREIGGGEGAQLAAGLIGSAGAVAGTAPFRRVADKMGQSLRDNAEKANAAGYVIPPADLTPGPITEILSGVGGKIKTAQQASVKNQIATNSLARNGLGLTADEPLTIDALEALRANAAKAYGPVASAGVVTPTARYAQALDDAVKPFVSQSNSFPGMKVPSVVADIQALKSPQFDAGDALNTIRVLRSSADAAYRGGDNLVGRAYQGGARALEGALEDHLTSQGAPAAEMLKNFRDARQAIARSYTVQKALNPTTGDVSAQKIASDLAKGKPLSGDLRTIGEVGQAFPKATQSLKEAPKQFSVLDAAMALGTSAAGNPMYAGAIAARPIARQVMLSQPYQNQALKTAGTALQALPENAPALVTGAATRALTPAPAPATASDIMAATSVDDAIGAAMRSSGAAPNGNQAASLPPPPAAPAGPPVGILQPNGTFQVTGDPVAIREQLRAAGLSGVPTPNGVLVGRSSAAYADRLFNPMPHAAPDVAPAPEIAPPAPKEPSAVDLAAHAAAASPQNDLRGPTAAQFRAGNFKMGKATVGDVVLQIENPAGSTRSGTTDDGSQWQNDVPVHRGYLQGTRDSDGGKLIALVNPGTPDSYRGAVYVIDQKNPSTGAFDQHVAVFGAADQDEATAMYKAGFPGDWKGFGGVTRLPPAAFRAWAKSDLRRGPLSADQP